MGWKDDVTNVRTWEIWEVLEREWGFTDEDIKNMPLDCWVVAGIVQKIIREHRKWSKKEGVK